MNTQARSVLVVALAATLLVDVGCGKVGPGDPPQDAGSDSSTTDGTTGECQTGAHQCVGSTWQTCVNEAWVDEEQCVSECDPQLGCVECVPGTAYCEGDVSYVCGLDGSGYLAELCDPVQGVSCNPDNGFCTGDCALRTLGRSYIGCEYYAVVTANLLRYDFDFAVVISNASTVTATVTIEDGQLLQPITFDVDPCTVAIQPLPWDFALKVCEQGSMGLTCNQPPDDGAFVTQGAYHIRSTAPVTVYQFNPLDYTNGTAYSYTNDSSLLLPVNVLTGNYVIAAWQPYMYAGYPYPSMMTVVGTADDTLLTITTRASAGGGSFGRFEAGVPRDVTIHAGDALELLSNVGDLTGSVVHADKPVAVIAGHYATNIPDNVSSQDHLEEQIFPLETLSNSYVATAPAVPLMPDGRESFVRVIAAQDQTTIDSDPPVTGLPVTLSEVGDFFELPQQVGDYHITADKKILVSQYMVGQNAGGDMGDPAMTLAVATDQYRTSYLFHAPANYEVSYVNITAPTGATVTLDGTPISTFTPVGTSGFGVARIVLDSSGNGDHFAQSTDPFGITVYGYGHATSYWYPGGLDLQEIPVF